MRAPGAAGWRLARTPQPLRRQLSAYLVQGVGAEGLDGALGAAPSEEGPGAAHLLSALLQQQLAVVAAAAGCVPTRIVCSCCQEAQVQELCELRCLCLGSQPAGRAVPTRLPSLQRVAQIGNQLCHGLVCVLGLQDVGQQGKG